MDCTVITQPKVSQDALFSCVENLSRVTLIAPCMVVCFAKVVKGI